MVFNLIDIHKVKHMNKITHTHIDVICLMYNGQFSMSYFIPSKMKSNSVQIKSNFTYTGLKFDWIATLWSSLWLACVGACAVGYTGNLWKLGIRYAALSKGVAYGSREHWKVNFWNSVKVALQEVDACEVIPFVLGKFLKKFFLMWKFVFQL